MELDNLSIQITADATKASNAIDGLVRRLDLLTKELGRVNGNKLVNFSNSLNTISVAMNNFSGIKLPDFNRVVKGINKLATIDTTNLSRVGNELAPLANSISAFSNVNFDNRNLQGFINSLSRLASANVGSLASADFNALGQSLNQLATSLSNAPKIQQSVIQMTSAIANLAKSGANIPTVVNSLPSLSTALKNFMTVMSTAPTISADTITFSQAIAQLANSGQRAGVTAGNLEALGNGLRNLMTTLSRAPVVNSSIVQMTTALANLASQGNRVGSASNMLVSGLNRTHTAARRTSKGMTSLAAAFGKFYATYFLVIRGFKALWRSIKGTAGYIEAYNYFDVAMGKIGKDWSHQWEQYAEDIGVNSAKEYAESFRNRLSDSLKNLSGVTLKIDADGKTGLLTETGMKNLGLNIQEVTQYASQLASVTNSVGQTGEVSLAAASAFTKLGADMSSLFNLDYSQVMNNLQSGLIGQSRALYRYGIDITNATLQTKAYELGIEKAVSEMTQAEKMQLRMLAILEQSKVSWGDLANTINSPSNMIRQFTNNLKEAGMILGQLFIPLLQKVLPILNGVMIALKRLMVTIANFFGIKLDLEGFGQGFSGLEDDVSGVGDSLDDATNSAKKFKKQLAGFDELENLSSETGKSKLGVGGGIDLTDEILKATAEYEKAFADAMARMENDAQKWADRIVEFFTTGNVPAKISKALTDALNGIDWDSIYAFARDFGKGLADALNSFITPDLFGTVGQTIAGFLNTSIYQALSFAENFDWENFGLSIASGINNFFDTFDFGALAESLNRWVGGLWTAIKTAIFGDESGEGGIDFGKIFTGIGEFVASLEPLTAFVLLITSAVPVVNIFSTAMAGLSPIFTVLSSAVGAVNTVFSAFSGFIASASAPVLVLVAAISSLVVGLADAYVKNENIRKSFSQAVDLIKQNFAPALELITKTVIPDLQNGWKRVVEIMEPFGNFLSGVFVSIWQDMINPALTYVGKTVLPTLITTFENLWTKILVPFGNFLGNVFSPIVKIISELFEMFWKSIIVPLGQEVGGVFSAAFEGMSAILNNTVIPIVSGVINIFNYLWQNILIPLINFIWDKFKPVFENVFHTIGGIIEGLKKTFSGLITFITGVFSGDWGKAWEGIKDVFKGIMNGVVSIFEGIINSIINGLNNFFGGFRDVVSSFGDVIGVDIEIPKISNVELPRFATGGFPEDGLFMANRGELVGQFSNGKTAVANNEQITTGIANAVYPAVYNAVSEAMRSNAGSNEPKIKVFVGDRELTDIVIDGVNDRFRRTGNFAFDI